MRIGFSGSVFTAILVAAMASPLSSARAQQGYDGRLSSLLDPAPIGVSSSAFDKITTPRPALPQSISASTNTAGVPRYWDSKFFQMQYVGQDSNFERFNHGQKWNGPPGPAAPAFDALTIPDRVELGNRFIRFDTSRNVSSVVPGPGGQSPGTTDVVPLVSTGKSRSLSSDRYFGLSLVTPTP